MTRPKPKPKSGRPPLSAAKRLSETIWVRVSPAQKVKLDDAARKAGADTSTWLRMAGLEKAKETT